MGRIMKALKEDLQLDEISWMDKHRGHVELVLTVFMVILIVTLILVQIGGG